MTALQLPQRLPVQLVPAANRLEEHDRIRRHGDAAGLPQEAPREPDLRWLGSLICMATALASASAIGWMLF